MKAKGPKSKVWLHSKQLSEFMLPCTYPTRSHSATSSACLFTNSSKKATMASSKRFCAKWGKSRPNTCHRKSASSLSPRRAKSSTWPTLQKDLAERQSIAAASFSWHRGGVPCICIVSWEGWVYQGRVTRSLDVTTDKDRAVGTPCRRTLCTHTTKVCECTISKFHTQSIGNLLRQNNTTHKEVQVQVHIVHTTFRQLGSSSKTTSNNLNTYVFAYLSSPSDFQFQALKLRSLLGGAWPHLQGTPECKNGALHDHQSFGKRVYGRHPSVAIPMAAFQT